MEKVKIYYLAMGPLLSIFYFLEAAVGCFFYMQGV